MGKFVVAGLLALSGMSILSEYPLWGVGLLALSGLVGWMALQGRQAGRVERSRPTAARSARVEVQQEVNSAQREANRAVRSAVERARRDAQRSLASAVQRVQSEQAQRWVS